MLDQSDTVASPTASRAEEATPRAVLRLRQLAVCLLLLVSAFHQRPGLISNDTKLDLTANPSGYLERALQLWNPDAAFGQLQNQAYGYLFPMGPFHLLGGWLGFPDWVTQRLWMAALLITAYLGVLRLAARLRLGTANTRLLGALVYALSPRMLTEVGSVSAEVLPMALLPWVLLPLVGPDAEQRPRLAAARSAIAVLLMGAVNATAVLAVLPLPGLWLLPGLRRRAGRRLAAWWALCLILACSWWIVPLLLQGSYSPNFLNYIETAATTTSTTSLSEVVRGTSHWLSYLAPGGRPWWQAGWILVTNAAVVLNTAVLAGLCTVGLTRRHVPGQGRLVAAAAIALLAMSAAHAGPLAGPAVESLRDFLDGPLAPFRNVHKFEPLLRLALVLGLCHLLSLATPDRARRAVAGFATLALIGACTPVLVGQLVPAGAYQELPPWWRDAGSWLDQNNATSRALVVPASGFSEYLWGRTLENPLEALTDTPWAVRDAVPLGSPGSTRLLDAVGARLDTGQGSTGLAPVLARSGVRYLVVSNDLNRALTGSPRPVLVHQALADSPGIRLAASFGPQVGADAGTRAIVVDRGLDVRYSAVEIYEVTGPGSPVAALPRAGSWIVSGGPESLLQLGDRGLLGDSASVLAGDGSPGPSPRPLLTDALRRREVAFGSVRDNASATLTATQPLTRDQPVADVLPVPGGQHLATAQVVGARAVSASSSAADAGAALHRAPERQAFSAFDGDPKTAWVSGSLSGAQGEWVELELEAAVDPTGTTLQLHSDASVRGIVRSVRVRTDRGEVSTELADGEAAQPLAVPPGTTRHLRITVDGVPRDGFGNLVGFREVRVPGVTVQRTIRLPDDQPEAGAQPLVLLERAIGARDGCVWTGARAICDPALSRLGEDVARLDRTFVLNEAATLPITGSARPVAGATLDALLDEGMRVRVTASSRLVPDPAQRPATVLDGDAVTGWIAADDDKSPSLFFSWDQPRTLDQLMLTTDEGLPAGRPTRVEVVTPAGITTVVVPPDGLVRFPAVSTNRLELRITSVETRATFAPDGGISRLPVGLSEVSFPGLRSLLKTPSPDSSPVAIPCGSGPPVVIDGAAHPTSALGVRGDLVRLRPMLLGVCDLPRGIRLGAGSHRVVAGEQSGVRVEGLTFGNSLPAVAAQVRAVGIQQWDAEHRTVDVGPGEESYLVVHENANAGWRAELDGAVLKAARIDGWQQAWVLPSGGGGRVTLTFTPGRTFQAALVGGASLVMLLLTLAVWPSRRREAPLAEVREARRLAAPLRYAGALAVTALLGGGVGVALYAGLLVVAFLLHRSSRAALTDDVLPVLAGGALVLAGVLTALAPWNGSREPAAFGAPVQLLALLALAAAAAALSAPRSPSAAAEPERDARPAEG